MTIFICRGMIFVSEDEDEDERCLITISHMLDDGGSSSGSAE